MKGGIHTLRTNAVVVLEQRLMDERHNIVSVEYRKKIDQPHVAR